MTVPAISPSASGCLARAASAAAFSPSRPARPPSPYGRRGSTRTAIRISAPSRWKCSPSAWDGRCFDLCATGAVASGSLAVRRSLADLEITEHDLPRNRTDAHLRRRVEPPANHSLVDLDLADEAGGDEVDRR